MALSPGSRLGVFEIAGLVGKGGMGEVYRARDTKLGRDVAIKVLPEEFARDRHRLVRFEREAKVLASLNHPNIAAIYDFQQEGDTRFLVIEMVEGDTLEDCISKGSLSVEEALRIFVQIAEALEAAHEQGIVHRDLKPANVKITNDGRAKVLDFGLASSRGMMTKGSATDTTAPGLPPTTEVTTDGMILGTPSYMSPEQARGKPVDQRSDIWSFGCCFYESLTGRSPFKGETSSDTLARILERDPDWSLLPPALPESVKTVLRRSLEKDPRRRLGRIGDIAIIFEESLGELTRGSTSSEDTAHVPDVEANPREAEQIRLSPLKMIAAITFILLLIATVGGFYAWNKRNIERAEREVWARDTALPEISALIKAENFLDAFVRAEEVAAILPDDPILSEQVEGLVSVVSIETDPPGAAVSIRPYEKPEEDWMSLGNTPLEDIRLPRGLYRWRLRLNGYEDRVFVDRIWHPTLGPNPMNVDPRQTMYGDRFRMRYTLIRSGEIPSDSVLVEGGAFLMGLTGLPVVQHQLEPFFIDRTEVTNQAYKDFVDAGGYTNPDYWKHEFRNSGAVLRFDEAMNRFVDTTGRPGPATWEVGSYPSGLGSHPVQGVSWFEAAAYAEFREQQLPTIYHWNRAALPRAEISEAFSAAVVPLSNIGGGSAGPAPVASYSGMGHSGAYDMAGNVREWCYNGTYGQRYILGGAWSDLIYMFTQHASVSPWDRDPLNGFRCMTLPEGTSVPRSFTENLELERKDYTNLKPISDEIFEIYKGMFEYDSAPLNDRVDDVREDSRGWTEQTVSFDAVYGNERVVLHLYVPVEASSSVPVVVFLPGIDALQTRSYNTRYEAMFDFVLKSGRAVAFPVYSGHYERGNDRTLTRLGSENSAAQLYQELVQDLGRTVEYLESRSDLTTNDLAFWAHSLGGVFSPVMLAATDSFDLAIFTSCGLPPYSAWPLKPESRPETYLPRITIPTLILNGRFDIIFPVNSGQEPFVQLLGTADDHKRHVILNGGHVPLPRTPMVTEILAWLDRYQPGTQ